MTLGSDESLTDKIYEASVLPDTWSKVIEDIAHAAGGEDALLSVVQSNTVRLVSTSERFSDTWHEIFRRFPGASNPRTQRLLAARHAGFLTDSDVFDPIELWEDPLYSEILVPRGYGSGVATSINLPTGDSVVLNIERRAALGPFEAHVVQKLDGLRAHLARSALLSAQLAFERARTAVDTLAALGLAACAVSQKGIVIVANQAFEDERAVWTTGGGERLALFDRRADGMLHGALDAIHAEHGVGSIPVRRLDDGRPAVLHIVPIRRAARDLFGRSVAIVVLTTSADTPTQATGLLQALFDLTPTEATIAAGIAAGQTAEQIAHSNGKSADTVRNQLKSVLAKTGCRRQVDLARLLAQLMPKSL